MPACVVPLAVQGVSQAPNPKPAGIIVAGFRLCRCSRAMAEEARTDVVNIRFFFRRRKI